MWGGRHDCRSETRPEVSGLNSPDQGQQIGILYRILICFENSKGEHDMPLMQLVITLVVVGILLWLVNRFIPMHPASSRSSMASS